MNKNSAEEENKTTWNFFVEEPRIVAVLGAQWGDEGKGKLVDILASSADICARCNGGANAGHTLVVSGVSYAMHLLPCGILYENTLNLIGNGVVVHIKTLIDEINTLSSHSSTVPPITRLFISDRAHLLFDIHQIVDGLQEQEKTKDGSQLGTTKRGIGPCYSSKASRFGIRAGDLLHVDKFEIAYRNLVNEYNKMYNLSFDCEDELSRHKQYATILKDQIIDAVVFMHDAVKAGKKILVEGANAAMLDIDLGSYPYVTSSNSTAGGICTGLGLPPKNIKCFIGVSKSYVTRVGSGPFPTELFDENGKHLQIKGYEFGTTTGRPRRCGWLDLQILRYSIAINGFDYINLTKLDVLTGLKEIKLCVSYKRKSNGSIVHEAYFPSSCVDLNDIEPVYVTLDGWNENIIKCKTYNDLPLNAIKYIQKIEDEIHVPIKWIGVGPDRIHTILK